MHTHTRTRTTHTQDTGGPKKKRPKKDPNAPKKPLTAFMVWLQENRASIKAKDSTLSVAEVGKKAGELWRQLEDTSVSCSLVPRPPPAFRRLQYPIFTFGLLLGEAWGQGFLFSFCFLLIGL